LGVDAALKHSQAKRMHVGSVNIEPGNVENPPKRKKSPSEKSKRFQEEVVSGSNSNREQFPPGFNVVAFDKTEYRLPKLKLSDFARNGGTGYIGKKVEILRTIKSSYTNTNQRSENLKATKVTGMPDKIVSNTKHKVILVCGKTGVGKSTLINSMVNYMYGVQLEDAWRMLLIVEKKKKGGDADSCTNHISSYRLKEPKGGNIGYDLTIIDSPGFGDVAGITKDMSIVEEFKYLFDNVLTDIDAICFVVRASDNRLDAQQTYVFNNILNLWGKDVLDNIFVLMTFADGGTPNCLDGLNKHDTLRLCKRRLKINNSAFLRDPQDSIDKFTEMFWEMGIECFQEFFKLLDQGKSKAIKNSKDVMRQRDQILGKLHNISMDVQNLLLEQQSISDQKRFIKKHQAEIDMGKEVIHYENKTKYVQESCSNHLVTTCIKHQKSCHPECCVQDKRDCCMMDEDGHCTVCSCPHTGHKNAAYLWVLKKWQEPKSNWDVSPSLKKQYNLATKGKSKAQINLSLAEAKEKETEKKIKSHLEIIKSLRNQLERIALRPRLSTIGDYIDQLIENEESKPNRDASMIAHLKKLKRQEKVASAVDKKADTGHLLKHYR